MSSAARITKPPTAGPPNQRRFTVAEYHKLMEVGVLTKSDRCELIRGLIVEKPTINPPHATVVSKLSRRLFRMLGDDLVLRIQLPITLPDSEPEPDVVVAAGTDDDYAGAHPGPQDVRFIVEVGDSSLSDDQTTKLGLYAGARVAEYWVVNLVDRRIEVYTQPRGGKTPGYRKQTVYAPGDAVPVVAGGKRLGTISVEELLP
jgi:hypothetical protein